MACQVAAFVVFNFVSYCKAINLFKIFAISLPQGMQLIFGLMFLVCQRLVAVTLDRKLMIESLYVSIAIGND